MPDPHSSRRARPTQAVLAALLAFAMLLGLPTAAAADDHITVRDSGLAVRVIDADGITVHVLTAPVEVFANSTYLIETDNSLIAVDTQFLLPNAADMRAYADELGKPIDRMFITHEHPDHFLGGEVFADVPQYALGPVVDAIAANGQAEVDEKQADFGAEAIAGSFVTPEVVAPGTLEVDGVTMELERVDDAEAPVQLVIRFPDHGVIVVGDIVYSGVHHIMAGQPATWIPALEGLQESADQYPIVLPGHGIPGDPGLYDESIAWLSTAEALIGTAETGDEFKQGLIDAFPDLEMEAAIDFVLPFLFPEEPEEAVLAVTGSTDTAVLSLTAVTLIAAGAVLVARSRREG